MPKKNTANPIDIVSPKALRAAVLELPKAQRDHAIARAMGIDLESGEITVPDSPDLPPALRAKNRKRIDALPANERANFLGQS